MGKAEKPENRGQNTPREWGKWRGVVCSEDGCDKPAKCRGFCNSHYNKAMWASGYRPPSTNAESRRAARMRHRYGIEPSEYEKRVVEQGGLCAVCQQPPTTNVRSHWGGKLCVDHEHGTGRIRGLLCNDCNLAVGYGKTPDILLRAAQYLRDHS